MDTIFAPATARGRSGVAIVRVSGPEARNAVSIFVDSLPTVRMMGLRTFRLLGEIVDQVLVVWFEAEKSFTGEEVVEIHTHGSIAVVTSITRALAAVPGLRLADPGEFTRRALQNGRLDLTQVEGMSDLLLAETEAQRRQAIRTFSGALGSRVVEWRKRLVRVSALAEATIDFADEDLPESHAEEILHHLTELVDELRAELGRYGVAERIRSGFEVAIVGAPNAGKSTLLNRLAGREAALTSEIAGTTRDVIEVRMDLDGLPVTFLDTAGLRETVDEIERKGVEKAITRAREADLRIFLLDGTEESWELIPDQRDIVVLGKCDLGDGARSPLLGVSGVTGEGVSQLLSRVIERLGEGVGESGLITHERHRVAVERAIDLLQSARSKAEQEVVSTELLSEDVRDACRVLDVMVGRIGVESVLGEIFSSFCIGK